MTLKALQKNIKTKENKNQEQKRQYNLKLLFFLAADLRTDPALRPRPVSSVAFAYLSR
jgi:hypothetical protein